jgi:hypothetical protein
MRAYGVFQPELIELMKAVLEEAAAMLPEAKGASSTKAEIASYILACAANGEHSGEPMRWQMICPLRARNGELGI